MARKLQPKAAHSLADNLTAAVAEISPAEVSSALGALVAARLKRSTVRTQRTATETLARLREGTTTNTAKTRAAQRRIGRNKAYVATGKWNSARNGTWRHHMIATIVEHSNTHAAAAANAECGIEKFASQRLDFNWAVDNGFINWA